MNCSDVEKYFPQLAGNGLIEAATQSAALRHAEGCASCAARLAGERVLIAGVGAVRAAIANEQAPAHLEQLLLSAFRERATAVTGTHASGMLHASGVRTWKVAAVAAAILLAATIGTMVLVRSGSPTAPPQAKAEAPLMSEGTPNAAADQDQVAESPKSHRRTRRRPPRVETVTEYFPLSEGDDLESLEFTQVVRVELTPSALREVGLPASYASEGEFIKADIALGHDGIARAIRFVR